MSEVRVESSYRGAVLRGIFGIVAVLIGMSAGTTPADAKHHRHHKRHVARHTTGLPHGSLVTVPTAAGIRITVAASVAPRFQGFISDIVAAGYRPRHIGCYASGRFW